MQPAVERLVAIVGDSKMEPNLRLEAIASLGALRAVDHLSLIQDFITDEWPAMRAAALRAAAAMDQESFGLVLSGLDADRHWMVTGGARRGPGHPACRGRGRTPETDAAG